MKVDLMKEREIVSDGMRMLMLALYGLVIIGIFTGFATNLLALVISLALVLFGPVSLQHWSWRLSWLNGAIIGIGAVPLFMMLRSLVTLSQTPVSEIGAGDLLTGGAISLLAILAALGLKIWVVFEAVRFYDSQQAK